MKKIYINLLSVMFLFIAISQTLNAKNIVSPIGSWTTISDKTNKPRSIIKIKIINSILEAKIIKVFANKGDTGICSHCSGSLKNKPIKGLRIVWNMKPSGNRSWAGGKILDPKSGKIYKCNISIDKSGTKLFVRGYIGISLFGRSQTWLRKPD